MICWAADGADSFQRLAVPSVWIEIHVALWGRVELTTSTYDQQESKGTSTTLSIIPPCSSPTVDHFSKSARASQKRFETFLPQLSGCSKVEPPEPTTGRHVPVPTG